MILIHSILICAKVLTTDQLIDYIQAASVIYIYEYKKTHRNSNTYIMYPTGEKVGITTKNVSLLFSLIC